MLSIMDIDPENLRDPKAGYPEHAMLVIYEDTNEANYQTEAAGICIYDTRRNSYWDLVPDEYGNDAVSERMGEIVANAFYEKHDESLMGQMVKGHPFDKGEDINVYTQIGWVIGYNHTRLGYRPLIHINTPSAGEVIGQTAIASRNHKVRPRGFRIRCS